MSPVRLLLVLLFLWTAASPSSGASPAKSHAIPHCIRVLLRPDAALALRAPFATKRLTNPNIQKIVLESSDNIGQLLRLPDVLQASKLRPFLPEHSVVFENIREHINPTLFHQALGDAPITPGGENNLLRTSEEKLSRWLTIWFDANMTPERAVILCKKSPMVELAEPVYARELCAGMSDHPEFHPNDPLTDSLWALKLIHAFEAWKIVRCDSAIPNNDTMILADVDIGVDVYHEDLVDAVWHNAGEEGLDENGDDKMNNEIDDDSDGYVDDFEGWDYYGFLGEDKSPYSMCIPSHGTHTSGIMAATGNNGIGIPGVAFGAKLMVIKAAYDVGDNNNLQAPLVVAGSEGIVYATDHKAKVINCSFGGSERSQTDQDVVDYAYARGSIVVVAAGNSNSGEYGEIYPASCNHAFSVSAIDSNRTVCMYSTFNAHVAVAAPGGNNEDQGGILSTVYPDSEWPTGYGRMSGTSMAAPQVSGACGLVWQHFPKYTNRQVMERIRATCDTLGALDTHPGFDGRGSINIYRAVSDSLAYSVRIDDPGTLDFPSEGSIWTVQISLRNYLDQLTDTKAFLELLDDQGNPVKPGGPVSLFSNRFDIGYLGTLDLGAMRVPIRIDTGAPSDAKYLVRIWFSDSALGYTGDYDYFEFTVKAGFKTLDANNLTVSFDDKGNVGYRDQTIDQEGEGFVWTKSPPSIITEGKSVLLGGGLIIARDAQHEVDGLGSYDDNPSNNYTLNPMSTIVKTDTTPWGAGQTITASSSDSLADTSVQVGIHLDEHAYALATPDAANMVIADYLFTPRNNNTKSFDAGLYLDWDIGENGLADSAQFVAKDNIFYIWSNEPNLPVVGVKLVSQIKSGSVTYYALDNPSNFQFTDSLQWALLQNKKLKAGYGDVAIVLGVRGLSYADTARLTYIFGFGKTQAEVKQSLENTQAIMEGHPNLVVGSNHPDSTLRVWPDPAKNAIRVEAFGYGESFELRLWDAIGRCVVPALRVENGGSLDISKLPSGIYTVEVSAAGRQLFRTMVKE